METGKKITWIIVVIAAFLVTGGILAFSMQSDNGEQVLYYEDGDLIYRPSEKSIAVDNVTGTIYYDRMLVAWLNREADEEEVQEILQTVGGQLKGKLSGSMNYLQIQIPQSGLDAIQDGVDKLMKNDLVGYASYDYPVYINTTTSGYDTNNWGADEKKEIIYDETNPGGNNWWAEAIGTYTAWNILDQEPLKTQMVGVVDYGFDTDHPDLFTQITEISNSSSLGDGSGHGTKVAGVLAALDNQEGIRGVADSAKILGSSWNITGEMPYIPVASGEVAAVHKVLIDQGATVINDSWTGLASVQDYTTYVEKNQADTYEDYCKTMQQYAARTGEDAVQIIGSLIQSGNDKFMIVQSAGNGYQNKGERGFDSIYNGYFCSIAGLKGTNLKRVGNVSYDKIREHVMVVASVSDKRRDDGSYCIMQENNYGSDVDICAPGKEIYSTANGGKYSYTDGTSMSAAMVSGAAAVLWELCPSLTAGDVREYLLDNAGVAVAENYSYSAASLDGKEPLAAYLESVNKPMLNVGKAVTALKNDISGKKRTGYQYTEEEKKAKEQEKEDKKNGIYPSQNNTVQGKTQKITQNSQKKTIIGKVFSNFGKKKNQIKLNQKNSWELPKLSEKQGTEKTSEIGTESGPKTESEFATETEETESETVTETEEAKSGDFIETEETESETVTETEETESEDFIETEETESEDFIETEETESEDFIETEETESEDFIETEETESENFTEPEEATEESEYETESELPADTGNLLLDYLRNVLIPEYGVMSTDSWQLSESLSTWQKGDDSPMNGILSALIDDLDLDGDEELLTVRFVPGDAGRMYLDIYEVEGSEVVQYVNMAFDTSNYTLDAYTRHLTVFTSTFNGEKNLYIYDFFTAGIDFCNNSIRIMNYNGSELYTQGFVQIQEGWDDSIDYESGTVTDTDVNPLLLSSWQDKQGVLTVTDQATTGGEDENIDTQSQEFQEARRQLLDQIYESLRTNLGLEFYIPSDLLKEDGMGTTLTGRELFQDDNTYIAGLDNQDQMDESRANRHVNTMIPYDYTGLVRN